ncbi:hypothetical protein M942_13245 [Enterobacter ludwigii]|jgi:hypothetical protein|uniref:hypothetical protein n=1 Tax=Enterobacter ludwigii TaxID=299767 RepID=UPI0003D92E9B|nr:hypothetical protein [Enterobacter ludwigii]AHE73043.1 hypothetical protein M942_13245 [Enterobacter ludwigii]
MSITAENLRDGCQWFSRELTRLEQLNRPLSIDEFFSLTEQQIFIKTMFKRYGDYIIGLQTLDPESDHCNVDLLDYIEDALGRHTNVITSGTYGVVENAYLLAINVLFSIAREADVL